MYMGIFKFVYINPLLLFGGKFVFNVVIYNHAWNQNKCASRLSVLKIKSNINVDILFIYVFIDYLYLA